MKTMKKLFAAVLALMLVLSLAVPAMAAETTYTLTINQPNENHTYEVYQIFTGDLLDGTNDNNDETTGVILSNIKWGEDIDDGVALVAALKADDKELTYKSGGATHTTTLASVFSSVDKNDALAAQKIADILGQNQPAVVVDRFAEIVGSVDSQFKHIHVKDAGKTVVEYDAAKGGYKVDLPAGYYLVKDQEKSQNETSSFYTAYILQVVHQVTVTPKGSTVTLDKLINDTIDGTFTNVEDFDINDDVFYKLEGTLPTNLDAYETYYYKFVDKLPEGITFEHVGQIYIENADGQRVHTILDMHDEETNNDAPTNVTIQYEEATRTLTIEFENLKGLYDGLAAGNKVIVKYNCYVNRKALCNATNRNVATLHYENNPDGEGVGKTESNYAHAYTYKMDIQKYIQNTTTPLEGVEFLLYFTRNETVGEQVVTKTYYAKVITEEDVLNKVKINEVEVTEADVGVIYGWTLNRDAEHMVDNTEGAGVASVLDTDNHGQIHLRGLDADTYYLEETKTNQGYNLLTDAIPIVIKPEYQNPSDDVSTSKVEYYVKGVNQNDNWVVIVENAKGSTLPTTGGMGTTIFYVLGGVLVVAAVVVLVTKKRMSA